jgi:hypothetical protein
LTLLAQGTMPPMLLLEDAEDLCDFAVVTSRTMPPSRWAVEAAAAANIEAIEGLF